MADNHQIVANLFTQLEHQIFLGDRLAQGEFTTLLSPGQFLSTKLQETVNTDDMYIQADLTDTILDTAFVRTEMAGRISQKYKEILDFSALPPKSAGPDDEQEIEQLRQWLLQHDDAYTTYQGRYQDAVDAYNQETLLPHPDGIRIQRLAQKKLKTLQDWKNFGAKQDYENRQGILNQLLKGDPAAFWNDIQNAFTVTAAQAPRGAYYPTYFVPPAVSWVDSNTGWASFDQTISDSSTNAVSRSTAWSGGGGIGFGLWSFGASTSSSSQYNHQDSDTSNIHVKFDYLRVRIQRPWFDSDVFTYKWWTWKKAHGWSTISDGGNLSATPPSRPVGQMPFVPTHMILARNVELSAVFTHNDQTFITSQFSAGASVGWGPFSVSGSYQEANSQVRANGHFDGTTLTIAQPQIIAFTGFLVPKCPDPLPRSQLAWGPDAVLPSDLNPADVADVESARVRDLAFLRADTARLGFLRKAEEDRAVRNLLQARRVGAIYSASLSRDTDKLRNHSDGGAIE